MLRARRHRCRPAAPLQADGNIKLIDNESCLQHMWKNCGFDSILVPTTQKWVGRVRQTPANLGMDSQDKGRATNA